MNDLAIFENPEFGHIRGLKIEGEPWFVGKDIAEALGYADTAAALKKHVDDEDKKKPLTDDELVILMEKAGYQIARRTVAKYRQMLDIPVARLRREI